MSIFGMKRKLEPRIETISDSINACVIAPAIPCDNRRIRLENTVSKISNEALTTREVNNLNKLKEVSREMIYLDPPLLEIIQACEITNPTPITRACPNMLYGIQNTQMVQIQKRRITTAYTALEPLLEPGGQPLHTPKKLLNMFAVLLDFLKKLSVKRDAHDRGYTIDDFDGLHNLAIEGDKMLLYDFDKLFVIHPEWEHPGECDLVKGYRYSEDNDETTRYLVSRARKVANLITGFGKESDTGFVTAFGESIDTFDDLVEAITVYAGNLGAENSYSQ